MFLLILEQIGNMELLFIGLVVLIVFGPRKIPELAKTAGKWMYEIRKVSNEFKETWEREAELSEDERQAFDFNENTIAADPALPDIAEVSGDDSEVDDEADINEAPSENESNDTPSVTTITDEDQLESLRNQASEKLEEPKVETEIDPDNKQNWL